MLSPVRFLTVSRASFVGLEPWSCAPSEKAALMRSFPNPGIGTHRSRGNESSDTTCRFGSIRTSMKVSDRDGEEPSV